MSRRRSVNRAGDFDRPIMIDICKDGTISYRPQTQRSFNGIALPVFSVRTEEQALALQVRFGVRQYVEHPLIPGKTWYRWTGFGGNVDDLEQITITLRRWWLDA